MHRTLKLLCPFLLLLAGSAISYRYWHTTLGLVALLLSLLLLLPLVVVSLNDVRRERNLQPQPAFLEMNLKLAPTFLQRPLFGGPIAEGLDRIAGAVGWLEILSLLLTAGAGIGVMHYVGVLWFIHFVSHTQYVAAGIAAVLAMLVIAGAVARVPIALFALFGGAAVCGAALLLGYVQVLVP